MTRTSESTTRAGSPAHRDSIGGSHSSRQSPASADSPSANAETSATSHAKVILFGEHAVVHGAPAIVVPVHSLSLTATVTPAAGPIDFSSELYAGPLDHAPAHLAAPREAITQSLRFVSGAELDFDVAVTGSIPPERGLGSSAAVAAALSQAITRFHGVELTPDEHFALIQAAERVAHGTPSGLDARGVVADGPVWFEAGRVESLPCAIGSAFVVADTGHRGGTREAVADVRRLRADEPGRIAAIFDAITQHTRAAVDDLAADNRAELGQRMSEVHRLLTALTVSSDELDRLVDAALDAGALGAKLTGGGRGGCVVALAGSDGDSATIADALDDAGAHSTWIVRGGELVS